MVAKRLHEMAVQGTRDRILRLPEAAEMISFSSASMYNMRARGEGPRASKSADGSSTASLPCGSGWPNRSRPRRTG